MIKNFCIKFKQIDKKILDLMFIGFRFSFIFCIISTFLLLFYRINPTNYFTYEIGLIVFKMSLMFAIEFFICGFSIDTIKNK